MFELVDGGRIKGASRLGLVRVDCPCLSSKLCDLPDFQGFPDASFFVNFLLGRSHLLTITHKMITKPNFIIFEQFSVIPAL